MVEERLEQLTDALHAAEAFLAEASLAQSGMVAGGARDYGIDALERALPMLVAAVRDYINTQKSSGGTEG